MDEIKVSVITYVKNDAKHIEKCMKSVLNQTLKELEYIIVDGGSADGTLDIIHKIEEVDSRVRVLSADVGVGKQFNTGLKAAKGKYIGICESDDFLLPEMYEKEYEITEKYEVDFLQTNLNSVYEISGVCHSQLNYIYSDGSIYDTLICPCENDSILSSATWGFWTGLFNREFLLKNEIFMNETPGASYQDSTFFFLCKAYARRAYVMKEAFYNYRRDNIHSSTNDPKRLRAIITEYDLLEVRLKRSGMWEKYKNYCLRLRILAGAWLYRILSDEDRKVYFPILRNDLIHIIEEENYTAARETDNELNIINAAQESDDMLFRTLLPVVPETPELDQFEKDISDISDNNNVVIFGAGKLGKRLWLFLAERGLFANYFVDNSQEKQGTAYCNTVVLSPDDINRDQKECFWIIANLKYSNDIKNQLITMGIGSEKILTCPGNSILKRMCPYERG